MKRTITTFFASVLMLSLVGCAGLTNQDVGVVTGGAIGGAVGSLFGSGGGKIAAAVGGTILGAVLGGSIGKSMDRQDQMNVQRTLNDNRTNQATTWHNPDNGNVYTVKPTKTYYRKTSRSSTQPCRDYTTKAIIGGKTQTIYGKACRMDDGTWKVIG